MATAGEQFMSVLTNRELKFMENHVGCTMQDWESDASGIDLNVALLIVAKKRLKEEVDVEEVDDWTPQATSEAMEAAIAKLGFKDDEGEEVDQELEAKKG